MKNYLHTYHALGLDVNNIAFDFLANNEILQWFLSKRICHVSDIDRARANRGLQRRCEGVQIRIVYIALYCIVLYCIT